MASSNTQANQMDLPRRYARFISHITSDSAIECENFFAWKNAHANESTTDFKQTQRQLQQKQELPWNPVQDYLLFLCWDESGVKTVAANKFSTFAHRSSHAALKRLSNFRQPISMHYIQKF